MSGALAETCIVGIGSARSAPVRDDVNTTELAWEAVSAALGDAGVELRDIEGAMTASQDFWEGRTISSMAVNEVVGGTLGSEAKVAADGAMAMLYAMARIADGDQHLNLVLAHAKESQAEAHDVELAGFDPFYHRQLDPDERVIAALQASLFYAASGFTPEHSARVVAAARRRSPVLEPVSVSDVLASAPTADPLRELDRAPFMDAATALVICDAKTAASLGKPAVRVVAGAARTGAYWTDRDLTRDAQVAAAVEEALTIAGWRRDELDRIDLNVPFAHQHLLLAGELGLGSGEQLIARLEGEADGPTLNPSGAWLGGSAGTVAGLASIADAAGQLRREGGRALVHGATGLLHQSHAAVLLKGEE